MKAHPLAMLDSMVDAGCACREPALAGQALRAYAGKWLRQTRGRARIRERLRLSRAAQRMTVRGLLGVTKAETQSIDTGAMAQSMSSM